MFEKRDFKDPKYINGEKLYIDEINFVANIQGVAQKLDWMPTILKNMPHTLLFAGPCQTE